MTQIKRPHSTARGDASFCDHCTMSLAHESLSEFPKSTLLVACLCAQWCRTCDDYRPLFTQLNQEFPDATFRWVDIEDESDLVDPIEVENFPTILIAGDGKACFFGTVTPHIDTLRRLIQARLESADASGLKPEVHALVKRMLENSVQPAQNVHK